MNIKQATRQLALRPGLAIAVIGMLAIGIGVTTGIFSLFQQVLLRRRAGGEFSAGAARFESGADGGAQGAVSASRYAARLLSREEGTFGHGGPRTSIL